MLNRSSSQSKQFQTLKIQLMAILNQHLLKQPVSLDRFLHILKEIPVDSFEINAIYSLEDFHFTLLQWACVLGYLPIVKWLVDRGAHLNIQDPIFQRNALHLASRYNHPKVIQYLLSKGADRYALDRHYHATPYALAQIKHSNLACQAFKSPPVREKSFSSKPHEVLTVDDFSDLVARQVKNTQNRSNQPRSRPKEYSVRFAKRIFESLLTNDTKGINDLFHEIPIEHRLTFPQSFNPVHHYCKSVSPNPRLIYRLVKHFGVNLNTLDQAHRSPISYAIEYKHYSVVRLMLTLGADLHLGTPSGLDIAQWDREQAEIFSVLLGKSLDKHAFVVQQALHGEKLRSRLYALVYQLTTEPTDSKAITHSFIKTLKSCPYLSNIQFSQDPILHQLIEARAWKLANMVVAKGVDLQQKDSQGRTPLDVYQVTVQKNAHLHPRAQAIRLKAAISGAQHARDKILRRYHSEMLSPVEQFNQSPQLGIQALIKMGINTPKTIIHYLLTHVFVNQQVLGEVLGQSSKELEQRCPNLKPPKSNVHKLGANSLLNAYNQKFILKGLNLLDALSVYLKAIQLPYDVNAQDRILYAFAKRVFAHNPHSIGFKTVWEVFKVVKVVISMHSAHGNISSLMSRTQFLHQPQFKALNPNTLTDVYEQLKEKWAHHPSSPKALWNPLKWFSEKTKQPKVPHQQKLIVPRHSPQTPKN